MQRENEGQKQVHVHVPPHVGEVQPPVAVACERVWQPELETGLDPVVMEVTHTVECWMSRGTRRREVYFEFLGHSCASRDLKLLVDTTQAGVWREEEEVEGGGREGVGHDIH